MQSTHPRSRSPRRQARTSIKTEDVRTPRLPGEIRSWQVKPQQLQAPWPDD